MEDYRTDYMLYQACKGDVGALCPDVEPGENREMECLVRRRRGRTAWLRILRVCMRACVSKHV